LSCPHAVLRPATASARWRPKHACRKRCSGALAILVVTKHVACAMGCIAEAHSIRYEVHNHSACSVSAAASGDACRPQSKGPAVHHNTLVTAAGTQAPPVHRVRRLGTNPCKLANGLARASHDIVLHILQLSSTLCLKHSGTAGGTSVTWPKGRPTACAAAKAVCARSAGRRTPTGTALCSLQYRGRVWQDSIRGSMLIQGYWPSTTNSSSRALANKHNSCDGSGNESARGDGRKPRSRTCPSQHGTGCRVCTDAAPHISMTLGLTNTTLVNRTAVHT
jgi:hypothetical protein